MNAITLPTAILLSVLWICCTVATIALHEPWIMVAANLTTVIIAVLLFFVFLAGEPDD